MPNVQCLSPDELFKDESLTENDVRSQIEGVPAGRLPPPSRESVAAWIAVQHFDISPEITDIYYLPTRSPKDEIRLLEVNRLVGHARMRWKRSILVSMSKG